MTYCLDTSALIEPWVRLYPPDSFPSFWERVDMLAESGRLVCPEEVLHELQKKQDDLHKWAKARQRIFAPLDGATQTKATEVLGLFPKLVDTRKDRSEADPFVVAFAAIYGKVVVTEERNRGTPNRPRIPMACAHYRVECIRTIDLIRREGWSF